MYLFDGLDSNFFCNGKGLLITVSFPSSSEEDSDEELEDPEDDGSLYYYIEKESKFIIDRGITRSIGTGWFSFLLVYLFTFVLDPNPSLFYDFKEEEEEERE